MSTGKRLEKERTAQPPVAHGERPADPQPILVTSTARHKGGNLRRKVTIRIHSAPVRAPRRNRKLLRLREERRALSARRISIENYRTRLQPVALPKLDDGLGKLLTRARLWIPVLALRERRRNQKRPLPVCERTKTELLQRLGTRPATATEEHDNTRVGIVLPWNSADELRARNSYVHNVLGDWRLGLLESGLPPRLGNGAARKAHAVNGIHEFGLRAFGRIEHVVLVVTYEHLLAFLARNAMREKRAREAERIRRHVVRMIRERLPDYVDPATSGLLDKRAVRGRHHTRG